MFKSLLRFLVPVLGIILIGGGVWYGIQYWRYINSEEYQAIKYTKEITKKYAEDTFGGDTPEETLRLFIDALKKGDTDLAARYFILDKQEEWKEDLAKIKEKGLLKDMIRDLERLEKSKEEPEEVFYVTTNEANVVSVQLIVGKNPYSKKWKIYEL
ncbi:MAG: hypothetical protein HYW89_00940 [Candidatus Sungiibacteriota bacterium]|uniref:DUF4878 domain-containing protein n=1 Tax=Candidatus Sungiibacteriota bacterium TaxID=2750080 RepID=A0A7T5RJV1_9BACT|nr:MAG: hypothetical protein HYW89_00940 [Candidatus Sungbacteria bacterium]